MMSKEMTSEICRAIAMYGKEAAVKEFNFTPLDYSEFLEANYIEINDQIERWRALNESN